MKKMYFAAVAVLLAVLIAGCSAFDEPPVQTPDNSEGLIISFSDGNGGRALTTPIAAAGADFYEVVFDNGTRKVRTSWGGGRIGRILPGDGNYTNNLSNYGTGTPPEGMAYLFAGRNGTLLGIGVLVAVNNNTGTPSGTIINMTTATEVVFEITALNTDVGGLKNPLNPPLPPATTNPDPAFSTFKFPLSGFSGQEVGTITLDNLQDPPLTAPVFGVDANPTSTPVNKTAEFDITNTTGVSFGPPVPADPGPPPVPARPGLSLNSVIIASATSTSPYDPATERNRVIVAGFIWDIGEAPLASELTGRIGTLAAGTPLTIPIPLTIDPGVKVGIARVSIEIPVFLYSNDSFTPATGDDYTTTGWKDRITTNRAAPVQWYIRGGLNNTSADQGATFNDGDGSLGGAILIGVGEYNKNAAGLIVIPGDTK